MPDDLDVDIESVKLDRNVGMAGVMGEVNDMYKKVAWKLLKIEND